MLLRLFRAASMSHEAREWLFESLELPIVWRLRGDAPSRTRLRLPRARVRRSPPKDRSAKPLRFPSKFGWMLRFGSEVCCRRSQLEHWLTTNPEAGAFIAAAPQQAGRILRPLCHMLGIELPEALRRPKRERRPRPGGRKGQRGCQRDGAQAGTQAAEGCAGSAPSGACSARSVRRGAPDRQAADQGGDTVLASWAEATRHPMDRHPHRG